MKEGAGQRQVAPLIRFRFAASERWSFPKQCAKHCSHLRQLIRWSERGPAPETVGAHRRARAFLRPRARGYRKPAGDAAA